jgi:hypothetical protein
MPKRTYREALHAMQTGVAMELESDPRGGTPKHLRVGVNAAMSDHAALARLLIRKGVISEEEYAEAVRVEMNDMADGYEEKLSERYGRPIKLK